MAEQPVEVCFTCGRRYGNRIVTGRVIGCWSGKCGVCGEEGTVTAPRDFGFLKPEWEKHHE